MSENDKETKSQEYAAGNIKILEGLSAVRKRPAMYIGSTGPMGLHHLVYEVIDEVIIIVIAVGRCENNAVYNEANSCHS